MSEDIFIGINHAYLELTSMNDIVKSIEIEK